VKFSWKYTLVGVLAYLLFVLMLFPASHLYALMKDSIADHDISIYGVQGTIWQGRAERVDVGDKLFQSVQWNLQMMPLLLGHLQLATSYQNPDSNAKTLLTRYLDGSLRLSNTHGRITMAALLAILKIPAIKLDGQLKVNMPAMLFDGKTIVDADGVIVWYGAGTQFPQKLVLGDLSAKISTLDNKDIQVRLSDAGGPLDAQGELVLSPDGNYRFQGAFGAREGGSSSLGRSLSMLGRMNAEQKVEVDNSGNIADFGFLVNK